MADDFLILSDAALGELGLTPVEITDAIETAVLAQTRGKTWTVPKSALLPGDGRYMMTTLSASDTPRVTAVKSVMVSPRNPDRGLPGIDGAILLQDSETGALLALMQAGWVTAVRTAGLSAVVARRLADPASARIAFIGAGQQARSHLDTFRALFPLSAMQIYGRGQANIDRLSDLGRAAGLEVTACETPQAALEGADIVVSSVTLAFDLEPFLDAGWLKPGAFAAITDAGVPWHDHSLSAFDTVVIDDAAQERDSANKMVPEDLVTGDLPAFLSGPDAPGFAPSRRAAFIFRGLAIGDFAVASLALQKAQAAGAGTRANW